MPTNDKASLIIYVEVSVIGKNGENCGDSFGCVRSVGNIMLNGSCVLRLAVFGDNFLWFRHDLLSVKC